MKKQTSIITIIAIIVIAATPALAAADIPSVDSLSGKVAIAYWDYYAPDGAHVVMNAVVAEQMGGNPDQVYVQVSHLGRNSETTVTQTFTWSMSAVYVDCRGSDGKGIVFPWVTATGSSRLHNVTVVWAKTTDPITLNQYVDKDGVTQNVYGEWQKATAIITIDDGSGPHPLSASSTWAIIGLKTPDLFVLPEYPVAAIGALAAAFVAFACYRSLPKLKAKYF
jgi:hypothetical protein